MHWWYILIPLSALALTVLYSLAKAASDADDMQEAAAQEREKQDYVNNHFQY